MDEIQVDQLDPAAVPSLKVCVLSNPAAQKFVDGEKQRLIDVHILKLDAIQASSSDRCPPGVNIDLDLLA